MQKILAYVLWGVAIVLVIITIAPLMANAEGCDSTTNSNCIETNSNTSSKVDSNLTSTTTVKSPLHSRCVRCSANSDTRYLSRCYNQRHEL